MSRLPQIAQVAAPTARGMRWAPLGATGIVALTAVALVTHTHIVGGPGPIAADQRITALRVGAVFLGLGAAFLLDDPSADLVAPTPMPPLLRRAVRLGLALLVILPMWGLISLVAQAGLRDPGGLPLARVSSEALTVLIVVWAAAAVTERFVPERFGGLAAGPILIVLIAVVAAAPFLPGHVRMLPATQRAAGWSHAHVLWLRVLVTAAVVLFLFSRDPGRARLRALAHAASS